MYTLIAGMRMLKHCKKAFKVDCVLVFYNICIIFINSRSIHNLMW